MSSALPASGFLLWGRAAVLSTVALGTGALAHVQADGRLPGAGVLVALVVGGTLVSAPFLLHPGSTRRIVALLVAGQSFVHLALSATAGHHGDPASRAATPLAPRVAASSDRRGSYFDVAYAPTVRDHAGGLGIPAPLLHAITDISAQPLMALLHLLAAAACGWWLAMGERALWQLIELTSCLVRRSCPGLLAMGRRGARRRALCACRKDPCVVDGGPGAATPVSGPQPECVPARPARGCLTPSPSAPHVAGRHRPRRCCASPFSWS